MPENLTREESIARMCRSGKYDTDFSGAAIPKCNLFLDEAVKKHWNVSLPRHSEDEIGGKTYPGWKDRPMRVLALQSYLKEASKSSESGIRRVSHKEAASLTNQGELVVALGLGHATVFAPGAAWPLVYRSDLARRGEDKRVKVGLRSGSFMRAFHISPEQYKKYRKFTKASTVARP